MERAGVDAPRNSRTPPGDTAITRRSGDGRDGTWVWSDGSAEAGVSSGGGGGTLLILRSGECREIRVAAGLVCSSTRTELFAMRAAVEEVSGLSGGLATGPAVLCSDSQASLLLVAGGAGPQQTPIGADIWRLLGVISARGQDVVLQWVPTHFGLPGNEQADVLAKEVSELAQEVPTDVRSITKAVARSVNRAWRLSWPDSLFRRIWRDRMPSPAPGEDRGAAVDVHQLRAGNWGRSRQFIHRIGRLPAPACGGCRNIKCSAALGVLCHEEADTPEHVLLHCPCLAGVRLRLLGTIHVNPTQLRDGDIVAALARGYLLHQEPLADGRP